MTWFEALEADFNDAGKQVTAKRIAELFHYKYSNAVYALFKGELPFKLDSLRAWYEITGARNLMRWAGSVTNHYVAPIPDCGDLDGIQYSEMLREFSEVVSTYTEAVADGVVTKAEAVKVAATLEDMIAAAHRLSIATSRRAVVAPGRVASLADAQRRGAV